MKEILEFISMLTVKLYTDGSAVLTIYILRFRVL